MDKITTCHSCGQHLTGDPGKSAYGSCHDDLWFCYPCWEGRQMLERLPEVRMKLTRSKENNRYMATSHRGALSFPCDEVKHGRHNIAGTRTDVWFTDHKGRKWWGRQYGNNETLYCRKVV